MHVKFMDDRRTRRVVLVVLLLFGKVGSVTGQTAPGTRAAGMAGAFVALADDASAVFWNPAGLVFGPLFNLEVDYGDRGVDDDGVIDLRNASRGGATLVAVGVPPLGVSYYRLRVTEIGAQRPAEQAQLDRHKDWRSLRALTTAHVGVTVLQSVGERLTVGATGRLVRGTARAALEPAEPEAADEVFGRADALDGDTDTRGDIDVGAIVAVGSLRLGIVARNLFEPTFGGAEDAVAPFGLDREVRIGGAWGSAWPSPSRVVVTADADLTDRHEATGERRDVAAGVETWWLAARLGVRGGVRASTRGDARPLGAAGVSLGVRPRMFVDAHAAWGRGDDRGWGLGARFVF
jgi:hypothetical protein